MAKDGVRQRKSLHKDNGGGGGGGGDTTSKPAKSSAPAAAESSAGMTCFNWFVVLFLIIGVSVGASFFIYQEMTLTNRALLRELQQLKKDASAAEKVDTTGITKRLDEEIRVVVKKLDGIDRAQKEMQKANAKSGEDYKNNFAELSHTVTETQNGVRKLRTEVQASLQEVISVRKELDAFKESQSSDGDSSDTAAALKRLSEQVEVANTNIRYLSDEVLRMDKKMGEQFDQHSSVQKEVIDLTAEKMIATSAIESIKSTIVAVRERVEVLESGGGKTGDSTGDNQKYQELEKKTTEGIERLSRELSETRENSAKWLQHSTDELTGNFQKTVEDLVKQFNELKVQIKEPTHATENQSLINSIASLDSKIRGFETAIEDLREHLKVSDGKHDAREKSQLEELEVVKRNIAAIMTHIRSVKEAEDKMTAKMDALSGDVTSTSNEVNRLSTTARILEERVGAVKSSNEKLDNIVQEILGKEEPVKK